MKATADDGLRPKRRGAGRKQLEAEGYWGRLGAAKAAGGSRKTARGLRAFAAAPALANLLLPRPATERRRLVRWCARG